MRSPRVPAFALAAASVTVLPGILFPQAAPTIQDYARACYAEVGDPAKATDGNPFVANAARTGLDCTSGKLINVGGLLTPEGRCLSPSWAKSHSFVPGGNVPYECYPGSYVKV